MKLPKNSPRVQFNKSLQNILFVVLAIFPIIVYAIYTSINSPIPKFNQAPEKSNYLHEAGNALYKVKLGSKIDNSPTIQYTEMNGNNSIYFTYLSEKESNKIQAQTSGRKLLFKNVDKHIDLEYITLENGLKENIIIKKPQKKQVFFFETDIGEIVTKRHYKDSGTPAFYDKNGNYLFNILPGYAVDAVGNRTEEVSIDVIKSQGKHYLRVMVDEKWLNSSNRRYPIRVDPTIIQDTSSEFSTGEFNRSKDTGSGSNPVIETYYQELATDPITVGLWHLNEASGNAIDASGNGNTGTPTGTSVTTGILGNARSFNGTSDYIATGSMTGITTGNQPHTIEAWIKPNNTPSTRQWPLVLGGSTGGNVIWLWNTNATMALAIWDNQSCSVTPKIGSWNHIAHTYDGSILKCYLNGELTSSIYTTAVNLTATTLKLAQAQLSEAYFNGSIDEVRVSNAPRTEEEIKLSASGRPYSTYTSDVIDFGDDISAWTNLSWNENGVLTGDGETLADSTALVAQWNLNEPNGTVAVNNAGSCGASCNGTLEGFTGTASQDQPASPGTGGTITTSGGYRIHTFTTSGTFTLPSGKNVEYLVVGGGGGGGNGVALRGSGGGGGAGGMITGTTSLAAGSHSIVVGAGGTPAAAGANSSINSIEAIGGGRGGQYSANPTSGGSGGGAQGDAEKATTTAGGAGTAGQGNKGQDTPALQAWGSGGGGKAGEGSGATGGAGLASTITGASVTYSRGGNAGGTFAGGWTCPGPAASGAANTGNAGYGGDAKMNGSSGCEGGSGGSGIVVVRYLDESTTSGWTAQNRRWGTGAVSLDGVDDVITMGDQTPLDFTGSFTLSAWVKTTSTPASGTYYAIAGKGYLAGGVNGYGMYLSGPLNGGIACQSRNDATTSTVTGRNISDGKWHYVVCVRDHDANSMKLYLDGQLQGENITALPLGYANDRPFGIGMRYTTAWGFPFQGTIDSVAAFSRPLSANEILSNYQSGQIDIQTRVGGSNTPNDGSWDDWAPVSGETSIESFDTTITKDLISYWDMDETSGTRFDRWNTNNLTQNGTGGVGSTNGRINNSAQFINTESDFLEISDNDSLSTDDIDFTISTWINRAGNTGVRQSIVTKSEVAGSNAEYELAYIQSTTTLRFELYDSSGSTICTVDDATTINTATWYFVVAWHDSVANTCNIKVNNGTTVSTNTTGVPSNTTSNLRIGARYTTEANFFLGSIDEVGFWKRSLSATEIATLYGSGSPKNNLIGTDLTNLSQHGGIRPQPETVIVQENSGSTKYSMGKLEPDGATVGLWHLDETSGTGAYIKDSSSFAHHGTPVDVTNVKGISDMAKSFNGTTSAITTTLDADANNLFANTGVSWTVEAWYKHNGSPAANHMIVGRGGGTGASATFGIFITPTNEVRAVIRGTQSVIASSAADGRWHHVAVTWDGTTAIGYFDGGAPVTLTAGAAALQVYNVTIGTQANAVNTFYTGSIDEVRVSNIARSADEISEAFRMSRDHYINRDFSSTNISSKVSLPMYIASDRPGTYLQATMGESAYVNNQPDSSTVGQWRMEEKAGTGAYLKDSSGNNNQATPTGTVTSSGKIGNARSLSGTDYITKPLNGWNPSAATIEMWVKPDWNGNDGLVHGLWQNNNTATTNQANWVSIFKWSSNQLYLRIMSPTAGFQDCITDATKIFTSGKWTHIAATYDATGRKIYANGSVVCSRGAITPPNASLDTNGRIGYGHAAAFGSGSIDEVRISSTSRTSDEIRAAYEYGLGLRSHPITIDFAANLDNTNLIANGSDYSFTIDARTYGLSTKGGKIYTGEKIVIKENYNGIEYIAQGTVTSVNESTGAITVVGWDAGSTFPSVGFGVNATAFKWQREHIPIQGRVLVSELDAVTQLSLRVTDGKEARTLWIDDLKSAGSYLTNPTSSAIQSSVGNRYLQYKIINTSSDSNVSSSISQLTIDYVTNYAPTTPTLDSPNNLATGQPFRPILQTTASDVDLDYLRYKIELCKNASMTIQCTTFDQTSTQTGWSGQNTETSTAYTSGTQATYTLQYDLEEGKTYYWRSYTIDPAGTNSWSETQSTPRAFTINALSRSNISNESQKFISKRESTYISSVIGWNSISGAAETGTTASANGWIAGSNFTVGEKYLILAWGSHQSDSTSAKSGIRIKHGATPFTESQTIETTQQTSTSYKTPYFWFTVWDGLNEDIEAEIYWDGAAGTEARVEDVTVLAINVTDLIAENDLQYNISNTGGALDTTFTNKASITFTPNASNDTWWIMGYTQADIVDINSDRFEARLNINGSANSPLIISGKEANDTPLYGIGFAQQLANTSQTLSLQIRESAANQEWDSAGIFALNLSTFDTYMADSQVGEKPILSTPSDWVEQSAIDPLVRKSGTFITASGAVVNDGGARVINRLQSSDINITDDTGGWRQQSGDITPLTLGDVNIALSNGLKNIDMDSQTTLAGNARLTDAWTVGFTLESASHGAGLTQPTNAATNHSIRPQFKMTSIDPDNDTLMYKIDLCTNSLMTVGCQTFDQQSTQTGWSGQNANSLTRYTSGTEATYTLQSDLNLNTTYYWRGYSIDPSGTNTFSHTDSPYSFTTTSAPNAPSAIEIEVATNPTNVTDTTPEMNALHTDPDGDSAVHTRIQVSANSAFSSTVWETGKIIIASTNHNTRTPLQIYAGSELFLNGQTYYVRMKVWDSKGAESDWSQTATFTMYKLEAPSACHLIDSDPSDTSITIKWTDNSSIEDGYRIQRSVNGGSFSTLINLPLNSTQHIDTISAGNTYAYRIASRYTNTVSSWCTTSTADVKKGNLIFEGITFR